MTRPTYYAHSAPGEEQRWQRLSVHLEKTAERAAEFLDAVGLAEWGRVAGLLHDVGKYADPFQAKLKGSSQRFDHSASGARIAIDRYGAPPENPSGKMLAFCVAGHHAGLANGVNGERITALDDRLGGAVSRPDPIWEQEIALPAKLRPPLLKPSNKNTAGFCATFLIRMVFSALVDADYLDTEAYYAGLEGTPPTRGRRPDLAELSRRLDAYLNDLQERAPRTDVNDLRAEVLAHVRQNTVKPQGVFSLTVPTGGGKTLASLAFALDHAIRHRLYRVIYVIPYMSIIEQTASLFRRALRGGDGPVDFVIEHHSTFDEDRIGDRESGNKLRLAMENWDAPIIVTTAVQFFESLFGNRPSRCRKLHNIANSVVILDEAQTLPLKHLRPCVAALDELARNWRSSVVLCTATQPALQEKADEFTGGFKNVRELAPAPSRLYETLKRTRMRRRGRMEDSELANLLRESAQVLCIVNTRRHARELYERLADAEDACHLSTLMCASHRRERLADVRRRLEEGEPVRLIATSLVEAGVDLDFPVVWRAEAGLESIIQAAGRCNREGRAPQGDVFVFEPATGEGRKPPPEIAQFADAARSVMRRHPDDSMSLGAIRAYFRELYWSKGDAALDGNRILEKCTERSRSLDFPFESIAREFRLIDDAQAPVIVPRRGRDGNDDTAERLLRDLEKPVARPGRIARKLQPYVVQIPPAKREDLLDKGAARTVPEKDPGRQFVVLANLDLYDEQVGLTWDDPTLRAAEGLVY